MKLSYQINTARLNLYHLFCSRKHFESLDDKIFETIKIVAHVS